MKKAGLVKKLITATCLICALFTAVIVVVQTGMFKQALRSQQTERLETDGNAAQDALSLYIQQLKSLTISASCLRELQTGLPDAAARENAVSALADFAERNAEMVRFALFVGDHGETLCSRQVILRVLEKTMRYGQPARIAAATPRGLSVTVSGPYRSSLSTEDAAAFSRTVYDRDKRAVGTVILEVDMAGAGKRLQSAVNLEGSSFLVVGSDGSRLLSGGSFPLSAQTEAEILGTEPGWHSLRDAGSSYRVFTCKAQGCEWHVALILDESRLYASMEELITRVTLISLALLCSLCAAIVVLTRHFIVPLRNLAQVMNSLGDGELTLPPGLGANRQDEIGDLTRAFQNMLDRIRRLMNTQRETERARTRAELRALSQQLRPHFLYNALNSIGGLAARGEADKIPGAVSALIHLLAMCTDKTAPVIPLREEIQTVRYYLDIMALRYGSRFDAAFQVPDRLGGYAVPKLILQPLAENAVFHGLHDDSGRRGLIEIEAYAEDGALVLAVMDNGTGMPPEQVEKLLQPDAPDEDGERRATGLRNTHQRIQLYFGPEWGLSIRSVVGAGTRVEARLPLRTMDEMNRTIAGEEKTHGNSL